jgi:pimeloyl-ACP methyl ester carboxylesterase
MADQGFVTTPDGARLFYRLVGRGAATVIVPNGLYFADQLAALWQDRAAVVYDLRNRGRSDAISEPALLGRGVLNDLDDLDAVRAHFKMPRVDLVGHSYVALVALHYARTHPDRVGRVVMVGPPGYGVGHEAPPPPDAVALGVFRQLGELQQAPPVEDAEARCQRFWQALGPLYLVDQTLVPHVAAWGRCDQANERAFLGYWTQHVEPSLTRLPSSAAEVATVTCPVLVVHGTHDRSAPYAAGRAWAARLPNARLLTVPDVAHAPWIEAPGLVIPALHGFLDGAWPAAAERVLA